MNASAALLERNAPPPEVTSEGFTEERAKRYASAGRAVPTARLNEALKVDAALDRLHLPKLDTVIELGTGQGFGTARLLPRLAPGGRIHGIDASAFMLGEAEDDPRLQRHAGSLDQLRLPDTCADFAFSIAAFHHIPNKWLTMEEVKRVLKPGARFLVVDVAHGTPAQETFDYIVRPYCTQGHDADFLDEAWASVLARRSGMTLLSVRQEQTDWHFDSETQMTAYVRDLFSLQLPEGEVRSLLDRWLKPYRSGDGHWVLPWSLGFFEFGKS